MTTILTLHLDPASQTLFDTLRQRHFPPERNHIPAHLTLFHTLPGTRQISAELAATAARTEPFPLSVTGLRSLGKGVAYTLSSPTLQALHKHLAAAFAEHLTPQDRQRLQPHIVIQNKVAPEAARTLLATLQPGFQPFKAEALGLDLWQYLCGPWQHLETFPFAIGGSVHDVSHRLAGR